MAASIRLGERRDVPAVHGIEEESYADPWPRSIFYLLEGRASGFFLVAEEAGRVVGYAIGELEEAGDEVAGHVLNLAVSGRYRRRGLGGRLLDELEARLRAGGAGFLFLEVRAGNSSAQSLYLKRGYSVARRLVGYYRGEDGLRMEKRPNGNPL